MKKLFVVCILFVAASAYAVMKPISHTTLNDATYVPVTLDSMWGCRDIVVYTADRAAFYVSSKADGSDGAPIAAGSSLSLDCVTDTNGVVLYAKAAAGEASDLICITNARKWGE